MATKTYSGIEVKTLESIVSDLLETARVAQTKSQRNWTRNVIDPFAALFEITGFGQGTDEWKQNEIRRQAQKTLLNSIGLMHQRLISALPNWNNEHTGKIVDVVNTKAKIIAEIKNKYNTVSGASLVKPYDSLYSQVNDKGQQYKGYTAYFVQIIPKTPARYNKPFTPPDNKTGSKRPAHERVRIIDGASFYALAHGAENALELVFTDLIESAKSLAKSKNNGAKVDEALLHALFKKAFVPPLPSS